MDRFDKKIADFYQSKSMSSERMQLLLAQSRSARHKRWLPAYAAALLLTVIAVGIMHQHLILKERKDFALREAAMNHITKLQVDFASSSLADLKSSMSELDFALRLPTRTAPDQINLIGARYCTIAGNLAAHLRFNHPTTKQQLSLFMTPIADELKHMLSEQVQIEGVNVRLWQENGLFYAMADSANQP